MYNPGTFAASVRSMDSTGVRSRSSEVTMLELRGGGVTVGSGTAAFPEAHPEMSPARRAHETAARGENGIIRPGTKPKEPDN
jgi:hypothetical protein